MRRLVAWFLLGVGVGALVAQAYLVTAWPLILVGIVALIAGLALILRNGQGRASWWQPVVAGLAGLALIVVPNYAHVAGGISLFAGHLQGKDDEQLLTDPAALSRAVQELQRAAGSDHVLSFTVEADRIELAVPDPDNQGKGRSLLYRPAGTLGASGVRDNGSAFTFGAPPEFTFDDIAWERIPSMQQTATEHMVKAGRPRAAEGDARVMMRPLPPGSPLEYEVQFRPRLMSVTFDADGAIIATRPTTDLDGQAAQAGGGDEGGTK